MNKGIWIIITIIIIGLFFIYSSNSSNELKKIETEQSYINQRTENNRSNLTTCLDEVDQNVKNDMLSWCKTFSQTKKSAPGVKFIDLMPNCSLPEESFNDLVKGWEKDKKAGREECYSLYPL